VARIGLARLTESATFTNMRWACLAASSALACVLGENDARACVPPSGPIGYVQEITATTQVVPDPSSTVLCQVYEPMCGTANGPRYEKAQLVLEVRAVVADVPLNGIELTFVSAGYSGPKYWLKDASGVVLVTRDPTYARVQFTQAEAELATTVCVATTLKPEPNVVKTETSEVCQPLPSVQWTAGDQDAYDVIVEADCKRARESAPLRVTPDHDAGMPGPPERIAERGVPGGCNASGGSSPLTCLAFIFGLALIARRRRK